jgi:hypothetical protein
MGTEGGEIAPGIQSLPWWVEGVKSKGHESANPPSPARPPVDHAGADGSGLIRAAIRHLGGSLSGNGTAPWSVPLARQKENLRQWAGSLGLLLKADDITPRLLRGGQQRDYFREGERVWKVTWIRQHASAPGNFLRNCLNQGSVRPVKAYCLLPVLAVLLPFSASANGGGYTVGIHSTGPFRPVAVDQVEMQSEKLDIELRQEGAVISIVYQLRNPGPAVKVEMGFPCSVSLGLDDAFDIKAPKKARPPVQLERFSLKADGKPLKARLVEDGAVFPVSTVGAAGGSAPMLTGWQVVKLPFAAGQTRTVSVSYLNPWHQNVDYISDNQYTTPPAMRYLFSAAALWKGPIKTGEVTIRATGVDPESVALSHPKRFQRNGREWKWSFTDFEPTLQDDLEILAGDYEFCQGHEVGTYVMQGKSSSREELQKSGKWFFRSRQYTATASSSLADEPPLTYGAANLTEYDRSKVWSEGVKGDGIGESVTLTMKQPVKATALRVQNGYWRDEETYFNNNRVKRMGVIVNGAAPFSVELPDSWKREGIIALPPDASPVKTVQLIIEEVYRGRKFRDTCLTGVDVETRLSKAPVINPSR